MLHNARQPQNADEEVGMVVRKSEKAYHWLRDEILSFRMQPGMFIDKIEICEKLSVSKQPVTAALTRLEQEGLVEIYPQRGSYVARLRLVSLMESLFVRGALESATVRRLAESGNEVLVAALKRIVEAQSAALAAQNTDRFSGLDTEFHTLLSKGLPFPQVTRQIDIGLATARRCHELVHPDPASMVGGLEGHRSIIAALEAHDPDRAAVEMAGHVAVYATMLEDFARTHPELFVG